MDEETFRRAKHAIAEIIRTEEAAVALEANNTAKLGELMNQSHDSLRFKTNPYFCLGILFIRFISF
jgi:galactokinase